MHGALLHVSFGGEHRTWGYCSALGGHAGAGLDALPDDLLGEGEHGAAGDLLSVLQITTDFCGVEIKPVGLGDGNQN